MQQIPFGGRAPQTDSWIKGSLLLREGVGRGGKGVEGGEKEEGREWKREDREGEVGEG